MAYYVVTFGTQGVNRENEHFRSKEEARKFAEQKAKEGFEKVFLDTFDEDNDLCDYEQLN